MHLKTFLDSLPADERAFVVAQCTWSCRDLAASRAFAEALAASGQEAVDEILGMLAGAARIGLKRALHGLPVGGTQSTQAPLPPVLSAHIERVLGVFAASIGRSRAVKDQARGARALLKSNFQELEGCLTDQMLGVPFPGTKVTDGPAPVVSLPAPDRATLRQDSLFEVMANRHSVRNWAPSPLSLPEVAFLLWATQGIRKGRLDQRTVPSGGARHPFETYLAARAVTGLEPGIWHYRPMEHDLVLVSRRDDLGQALIGATLNQSFAATAPLVFLWSAVPARTEWRYCHAAPKIILQDSGHLCQNLYLAAGALGCGACAIGAYDQDEMNALAGVDGTDEFVVYCAPVGRLKGEPAR